LWLVRKGHGWFGKLRERSEPFVRIRDLQAVLRRTRRYTVFPLFCIVQSMLSAACALAVAIREKLYIGGNQLPTHAFIPCREGDQERAGSSTRAGIHPRSAGC